MENTVVTISADINEGVETVWSKWNEPEHIVNWNFASDDWHCPRAENDLRPGGKYSARMEAKDGSFGFDLSSTYDEVVENEKIVFTIDDGRKVETEFHANGNFTTVTTKFEAESENPVEMQREGWQSILDNFKKYVEAS